MATERSVNQDRLTLVLRDLVAKRKEGMSFFPYWDLAGDIAAHVFEHHPELIVIMNPEMPNILGEMHRVLPRDVSDDYIAGFANPILMDLRALLGGPTVIENKTTALK